MDNFESTLQETLARFERIIEDAQNRILLDQQAIEEAKREMLTFQNLFDAYQEKKAADSEALATLYTSGRTDADLKTFSDETHIELPEEFKSEEAEKSEEEGAAALAS